MTFILLIAVIILIIVLISNKNKFQKTINDLQNIINSLNAKIKSFEQERENLNQKIESLEDNNNTKIPAIITPILISTSLARNIFPAFICTSSLVLAFCNK